MKLLIWTILLIFSPAVWGLTITSLNTQWYGRGGVLEGSPQDEYRDERILEFMTEQIPISDIMVFQEVTDSLRVSNLFTTYICHTYDSQKVTHQYVVICAKPELIISTDVDFAVQLNSSGLRPAMILNVKYEEQEISIVGLHLKANTASTASTDKRIKQVQALAKSKLIGENSILIGDFNTYDKQATEKEFDDSEYFDQLLKPINYVQSINETNSHTYISYAKRTLDRVWSRGVKVKSHKVYGPCNWQSVSGPFNQNSFYKRFISDHCAIQITL